MDLYTDTDVFTLYVYSFVRCIMFFSLVLHVTIQCVVEHQL